MLESIRGGHARPRQGQEKRDEDEDERGERAAKNGRDGDEKR